MQIDQAETNRQTASLEYPLLWGYRGKNLEVVHRGAWSVCDAKGNILYSTPAAHKANTFFRSAAKPFQALPLLAALQKVGKTLSPELLAVTCASHTGTANHTLAVDTLLEIAGLTPSNLQCGPHWPVDATTRQKMRQKGEFPDSRHNNCSGKHAGMLLACTLENWPIESYLDPSHPLQQALHSKLTKGFSSSRVDKSLFSNKEEAIVWAVDGCGAPVPYLPLAAMASLYAGLWEESDAKPIVHAVTHYPYMAGGQGRIDSELIALGNTRLLVKVGADGVLCASRPALNGQPAQGVALKIADGSESARNRVFVHLLHYLGWLATPTFTHPNLIPWTDLRILNSQQALVGEYVCNISENQASVN